jgi:transcriptional regulator with XRE-family HTH domain
MINKIEIERIKRGLSVADAASKANLSRSAWYRIVQGEREPKIETLKAMANAVGLKLKMEL